MLCMIIVSEKVFVSLKIDIFRGNKLSQSTEFVSFRRNKLSRMNDFEKLRGINFREFGKKLSSRETFFH